MSANESSPAKPGLVARGAEWAVRHRRIVVIGWLVLLIGSLGLSGAIGTEYSNNFSLPGTESQRAADLLKRDFPAQAGDSDQIVFATRGSSINEAAVRARVRRCSRPWRSCRTSRASSARTRRRARRRSRPTARSRSRR